MSSCSLKHFEKPWRRTSLELRHKGWAHAPLKGGRIQSNRSPKHRSATPFATQLTPSVTLTPWNSHGQSQGCLLSLLGPEYCLWWWPTPHPGRWVKDTCKWNRGFNTDLETVIFLPAQSSKVLVIMRVTDETNSEEDHTRALTLPITDVWNRWKVSQVPCGF